jgi:outer membrane lipoprotein-sorting protein
MERHMTRHGGVLTILVRGAGMMLLAWPAAAQDAMEILNRTADAYRHIRTWDIEQTAAVETAGVAASRTERRERYAAVEGKNRWELGPVMRVADGKYEWTYSSRTNQYSRREQEPVCAGPLPMGYWLPDTGRVKRARVVREDSVTVDGAAAPSYVVEIERDSTAELLWIDKSRYLVLQWQRRTPAVFATERVWTTALTKVSINEAVPDSVFTFVPPAGATLESPPKAAAPAAAPVKKKKKE